MPKIRKCQFESRSIENVSEREKERKLSKIRKRRGMNAAEEGRFQKWKT